MSADRISPRPIPFPKPEASLGQLLFRVYGYLRPYWMHTAGAYISVLVILALNTAFPQLIRWAVDSGISGNQPGVLTSAAMALIGLALVKAVINYLQGVLSETASQNVAFDIRNEI